MAGCGLLLLVALALTVRWRGLSIKMPPRQVGTDGRPSVGRLLHVYGWLLCVGSVSGLLAGLLVVGPGGRLAMRLLAATSPDAEGSITEASEVVGAITTGGTIAFFLFVGLGGGLVIGVLYVLLHRALPRRLVGGMIFGILLLITLGTRVDPLRPGNSDFDIVGPGWLAVTVFAVLAVGTGAFVATAAGYLSEVMPLSGPRTALYVLPLVLLTPPTLVLAWPVGLLALAGGALFVLFGRHSVFGAATRDRQTLALQVATGLLVLAALPGFASAVMEIVA